MLFALVVMAGVLLRRWSSTTAGDLHAGMALARDGTAALVEPGQPGDPVVTRVGVGAAIVAAMAVAAAVMGAVAGETSGLLRGRWRARSFGQLLLTRSTSTILSVGYHDCRRATWHKPTALVSLSNTGDSEDSRKTGFRASSPL
jgi:hypothetical protein